MQETSFLHPLGGHASEDMPLRSQTVEDRSDPSQAPCNSENIFPRTQKSRQSEGQTHQ